jgi:hypothetical protein
MKIALDPTHWRAAIATSSMTWNRCKVVFFTRGANELAGVWYGRGDRHPDSAPGEY